MKTKSEWVDGKGGLWEMTASYESDHTEEQLRQFVRDIQIDAWNSAIKQAAKIVSSTMRPEFINETEKVILGVAFHET